MNLWLVPALPLAGGLLNLLLGDRLGKRGTAWLACGAVGAAFVMALRRLAKPLTLRCVVQQIPHSADRRDEYPDE